MLKSGLAPYACDPAASRGRRYPEAAAPTRTEFQRDRDRIVHSTAFRRLVYKTQVFLNHEGDLFRTRLTHSLEVAQLGRSIARSLALNEDLVEAIALAHDLGHTPFGHAGQDVLNTCMADYGGFEHNLQSLRTVDTLEERYPQYDGLNLSFETREGILKHCSRANAEKIEAAAPISVGMAADGRGDVGRRFLDRTQPSLEAQLCNLADEIAYNAHDIDDGVRSGLITLEQLQEVPLFDGFRRQALAEYPALAGRRVLFESIRRMLSNQVYDVIDATRAAIKAAAPQSVDEARQCAPLLCFSADMRAQSQVLKQFLMKNLYRHPQVIEQTVQAKTVVHELFAAYMAAPGEMAQGFAGRARAAQEAADVARAVADYIAGMTDRFAAREHERLTGRKILG
ncbi:deoxyguanosinetriphosphate triphosphohydrolase [Rhodoferax koreense]|uniref:Deoxyguanosinetriphosphate triphosphohydrolase-like protein n=1 Tax=Rhodoferax koreensis TaxID=1842727 RepID=A0A1P8K4B7_9BURK|nr:deoxyguanosinetriphosphate triphosphohydrolase [Rhodoferax koreense]APW40837.1 deoxyguanosinetriphosphate triphosphohydrolase [Rhodoferax koreense]